MQKTFAMDLRNVGGLRTTADHLYKHQMAILNAKPAINIKPPKIIDQKKRQESKHQNEDDLNFVAKTFKACESTKKMIDNNQPFMKKKSTTTINKKQKHEMFEHQLNLKAQSKRIGSAGSMQERKKNQFDPIAHPPVFFRREGQNLSNVRLDNLIQHIAKDSMLGERNSASIVTTSHKKGQRSRSTVKQSHSKLRFSEIEAQNEKSEFVYDVPILKGQEKKDYYELKKEIIMIIFKHRIYKSDDLEAFFGRVLIHNPQLHMIWIEDIFNEIREEFLEIE